MDVHLDPAGFSPMPPAPQKCFNCYKRRRSVEPRPLFVTALNLLYSMRGDFLLPSGGTVLGKSDLEPIKAAVISSSLDAIVVIDEQGKVLGINPAAETLFGFSPREALGRPIAELIVPEDLRELHRKGLAAYIAGGPSKVLGKRVETQGVCKDGREIPIELTILEIEVDGRRVFTANIRDRSEHAARDKELETTRR
ncbi:MAG: PAS domain S-box protein, partial [Allosphingosinicella sp.]